ncbi:MAG: corrinoid protein [Candidatus Thorarchaeota archaeon]
MTVVQALLEALSSSVINGRSDEARDAAIRAIEAGIPPLDAITEGLSRGILEVGEKFGRGEVSLVELVAAARAMKAGMSVLLPVVKQKHDKMPTLGKVLIGTVEGDIHNIGKDMVATMLEASGFEVVDLGEDVPVSKFVEKATEHRPDIVAMSALLTVSMQKQRETIAALRSAGIDAIILVGGAPTTREWAEQIGADGWAKDASSAATLARKLIAERGMARTK